VPIVPLYGHGALRRRFRESIARSALPSSLLLHGPRGVGKQRLALWLGQLLLCTGKGERPCGQCEHCRYSLELAHPDLRWFFPRPRLADTDATAAQVLDDMAEAIADRVDAAGLFAPPSGTDGIFIATVRTIVQLAGLTPSMGSRKVFVLGEAERMVPQEGSEFAANAFLKLLEEPLRDTTLVLTTSEPDALLPTIRSRVISVRVAPLGDADVKEFLSDTRVTAALDESGAPTRTEERLRLASGAPGTLFAGVSRGEATAAARAFLGAVVGGRTDYLRAALAFGGSRARGFFSDVLDALTVILRERAHDAVTQHDQQRALAAARAVDMVEQTKLRAAGNINPQLLGASLARDLSELLA
jgi:DNA polymerase-3 subunit delta'